MVEDSQTDEVMYLESLVTNTEFIIFSARKERVLGVPQLGQGHVEEEDDKICSVGLKRKGMSFIFLPIELSRWEEVRNDKCWGCLNDESNK